MNGDDPAAFGLEALALDCEAEATAIADALRGQLRGMRRRGLVLGLSGGIDSSVSAALAVRAVGAKNVLALLMPEQDSDPESLSLGRLVADHLGIESVVEDIAPALEALGCYSRRDAFIRSVVPEYGPGWASKLAIRNGRDAPGYNLTELVVADPQGRQARHRLPLPAYLGIVAATNMKQRTRKQLEYFHADRLNFAVLGTPNRLEYDQGFFVKGGDGAADVKPIAHLYKGQVYALAAHLGLPEQVRTRPPTTDTYSLEQTQDEFYFSLPWQQMDLCLYALNHGIDAEAAGAAAGLSRETVLGAWEDIRAKRRATRHLHAPPLLARPVDEIATDQP
ncbi:MAG: NAD(+) synthase [Rhizobiaceae bacterium]|nr:NAD(+) synthase [Rhizobiaceae bacterium]